VRAFSKDSLGFGFHELRFMISLFLGEVLNGWNGNPGDSRIYMVRDGNLEFYLGKLERSIVDLILEHCGLEDSSRAPDRLGQLILDNEPLSNGWLVDLLDLNDCEPIIKEVTPMYKWLDSAQALFCLITYYGPCLNEKDNPNPIPLPERYK
jgi:hypothetical protein